MPLPEEIAEATTKAFGEPATGQVRLITYDKSAGIERPKSGKTYFPLCRSDILIAAIQVLKNGGENRLHAHRYIDGFWWVLSGRVRFYGPGDVVVAECGPSEGVLIPRMVEYWFESVGDGEAELLQVEARDHPTTDLAEFGEETYPRRR